MAKPAQSSNYKSSRKGNEMKISIFVVLAMAVAVLSVPVAHARRHAPVDVPPVRGEPMEYRAPHSRMGCVEAWQGGELVWRRQIYAVRFIVGLERDVQAVFIQTMALKGNTLLITNERKSAYQLDLDSLEVEVVKGTLVESFKP